MELRRGIEHNTFTIIARCPRSGALGIAVATYSLAVGGTCPAVKAGVGALASQAYGDPRLRPIAMRLLEEGVPASQALQKLQDTDPHIEYRQIGIVDREGRVAVYTGPKARPWAGHQVGHQYVAMGNALVGEQVIAAMARSFDASVKQDLEERLMGALEAGRDAGGQPQGQRSSVLIVYRDEGYSWVDLRVDAHPEPVGELRRVFEVYKPMAHYYYYMRPKDPQNLPTQDEWLGQQQQRGR